MKKSIRTLLFVAAAIIMFGGAFCNSISTEAAAKTTTTTSTKKSTKVIKLKKAAKNKTTKKVKTKKSTKKATKNDCKITTVTTVRTTTVTKLAAKKKTITTTIKTTVQTTKEENPAKSLEAATRELHEDTISVGGSLTIDDMQGMVDPMIIKAFKAMNYKIVMDSSVSYAGKFDARERQITLRTANREHLLHELGHYVSFITGLKDSTAEFKSIYQSEADNYSGSNKAYVTKDSGEYFAESVRDFYTRPAVLRQTSPRTYAYVEKCIKAVTDSQIAYINDVYYS